MRLKRGLKWIVPLLLVVAFAGYIWWSRILPPRIERLYGQAVNQYRAGDYKSSAATLEQARKWNPWVVRVNILLGWSYWRLGDARQAESCFVRAHRSDPSADEAKLGLAFSSLALRHLTVALPLFQELNRKHPSDDEISIALGQAYIETGQNLEAARLYEAWLQRESTNKNAQRALLDLYGYPTYHPGIALTLSTKPRPAQTEVYFRTHGDYLQSLTDVGWKDIYSVGVNIGPARPMEFPSSASRDFSVYETWFKQIGQMHANTVRVYTMLPPAFYQALRAYNETAHSPLWLIQEVWINDEVEDLYNQDAEKEFRQELQSTIDLLHGQSNLSYRRGHSYGIYGADVSRWVLALAVGREVEPRLVLQTNSRHSSETAYKGRYVSIQKGSPSETWFARMCDLAASYEIEKYNAQRPLTVVNWPPLDPISHPTEANYVDELKIRSTLGEVVPKDLPPAINDADAVSLDVAKLKVEPAFGAGLFALYHVYQHWPDFLLHEPSYATAEDSQGPNRYLGYLRELKKAYLGFPLLIGEYGLSTSTAAAHVHPQGWNNGGLTEKQQAELLVRFTQNIRDTGCAGGIVFAWQDEWWKHVHDSFTADFERPWDRNPIWDNELDPEKHFGLVGYEPAEPVPLLRGKPSDWAGAQQLHAVTAPVPSASAPGQVRSLYATSDFAYFYLRLDLTPGPINWDNTNYWIALNTLPGTSGSNRLPNIGVRLDSGANFLVQLTGPTSSRILIADNYNPNRPFPVMGRPSHSRIWRKQGMPLALVNSATFEDIVIEANPSRYGRDGTEFPAINYDRSPLPYGTADRSSRDFSSNAMWNTHFEKGMIELRIPWGLLLMSDVSRMQAFAGTDQQWTPLSRATPGISIAAFQVGVTSTGSREQKAMLSSLPSVRDGQLIGAAPIYAWKTWNEVEFKPYFKQSYFGLQKKFSELSGSTLEPRATLPSVREIRKSKHDRPQS